MQAKTTIGQILEEFGGDIQTGPFGTKLKAAEYTVDGVPVISVGEIGYGRLRVHSKTPRVNAHVTERMPEYILKARDIVFARKGAVDRSALVLPEQEGWFLGSDGIRVRFPFNCDARFFAYQLLEKGHRQWINQHAAGTTMASLNEGIVKEIPITVPPLAEQRAIASILGALDDKIEQNRRTAQVLEQLARAIFRAWFVDFEPVKAKAAGATSFPSMSQAVFDALPTTFVDSDIGPVPEGWDVGTIEDLATLSKVQVKPQEHSEEPFDHFSIPAFDAGMHAIVELGSGIKSNKFLVIGGCVLLSKLNPRIARIWLPPLACDRRQITSTEFLVFVPREPSDRHYLYCQFQQREFREELAQEASGTSNSHQRVRPNDVLSRPVVMPVPSIRQAFADITDPLFALQLANHDESVKLDQMRDYLLPKLLSGRVRVGDAERLTATVA